MEQNRLTAGLEGLDLRLLEQPAVPASLHNREGSFVYLNSAAERAAGMTRFELIGRSYTYLLPPAARAQVEAHFRRAVDEGEPAAFDTVFEDWTGRRRGARALHLPVRDNDMTIGVLILAFEVEGAPRDPDVFVPPHLTARQREVLGLIDYGLNTDEIASELSLSRETVRNHIRSALRELRAHTRPEAVAASRRLGLLSPRPLAPPCRADAGFKRNDDASPRRTPA